MTVSRGDYSDSSRVRRDKAKNLKDYRKSASEHCDWTITEFRHNMWLGFLRAPDTQMPIPNENMTSGKLPFFYCYLYDNLKRRNSDRTYESNLMNKNGHISSTGKKKICSGWCQESPNILPQFLCRMHLMAGKDIHLGISALLIKEGTRCSYWGQLEVWMVCRTLTRKLFAFSVLHLQQHINKVTWLYFQISPQAG